MLHSPRFPCFLLSLLAVVPIATADAATWYVDASAISGAGTSWKEPFHTIGEAVTAAAGGDSVWVAFGVYFEELILDEQLTLLGGFAGSEIDPGDRDLAMGSSNIRDENFSLPAIRCPNNCVIDGFTVSSLHNAAITIVGAEGVFKNLNIVNSNSPISSGGIAVSGATLSLSNCVIRGNTANGSGGGIYIKDNSTVTMTDCVIEDNEGFGSGGGIYSSGSRLRLTRCIIRNNQADSGFPDIYGSAGGILFGGRGAGYLIVDNCLIYGNRAFEHRQTVAGGASFMMNGTTIVGAFEDDIILPSNGTITNSILWGHNAALHIVNPASLTLTHSCIQGNYPGDGNISDDPLFRDPANGDFRLQHNSPCIDAGAMVGPADDLDGNPRPIDIPGVGREGDNAFDMGAFEFQLPIPPPDPRTDINQDGLRDGTDLLLFLQDWHRVSGPSGN